MPAPAMPAPAPLPPRPVAPPPPPGIPPQSSAPPAPPPPPPAAAPAAATAASRPLDDPARTQPIPVVPRPSAATPGAAGTPTGQRRVINPFLNNDPNQKAKRLARALVSDMVAYLPQKREEGLKNGTLKELFREEIKKSYEEYCDQIGKEFAESTTHFQEALNDVLAGGKKIF